MKSIPGAQGRVTVNESFVGLWEWSDRQGAMFGKLRESYDAAIKVAGEFSERRGALAKDGRFTKEGRRDELKKWAHGNALGAIAKARKVVLPAAKRAIEQRQEKLRLEGPDKSDLAGAVMRGEIRTWLRGMKAEERTALLQGDVDPVIALSVVEAPAQLSGVNALTHQRLVTGAIDALHPGERAEIEALQQATETTERALAAAQKGVTSELLMSSREFSGWLDGAPIDGAEVPRLVRHGTEVRRVVRNSLGQLSARPATAEEILIGRFVTDADPIRDDDVPAAA